MRGIYYQMDHMWWAPHMHNNSPKFQREPQLQSTLFHSFIVTLYINSEINIYMYSIASLLLFIQLVFRVYLTFLWCIKFDQGNMDRIQNRVASDFLYNQFKIPFLDAQDVLRMIIWTILQNSIVKVLSEIYFIPGFTLSD